MVTPPTSKLADWIDQSIAGLAVGNLAWVTWSLGGFLPGPMATAFPVLMATLALVVLRWLVIDPTGMPKLWWLPVPMLLWVGLHMGGLAEVPGRSVLHGLHIIGGAAAFWIGLHMARNQATRRILNIGVGGMVLGAMLVALYQLMVDPTWLPMDREQSIYYLKRSSGPFGSPNNFAAWLAVVLPVALGWVFCRKQIPRRWRWFPVAVAIAATLGIGLSLSRGVGLALFLVGFIWLLSRRTLSVKQRGWIAVGAMGISALGVWSAYQVSPEVRQRWDSFVEFGGERTRPHMWHIAVELWQESPWVGKGGGSFEALLEKHRPEGLWETPKYAHNDYLNTLMEYGVIGLLLCLGVAGGATIWGLRRRGESVVGERVSGDSTLTIPWGLAILGVSLSIDFHLQSPAILWLVGLVGGLWLSDIYSSDVKGSQFFTFIKRPVRIALGMVLAVGLVSFGVGRANPIYESRNYQFLARETIDDILPTASSQEIWEQAAQAENLLQRAVTLNSLNDQAWADLSYAISLQGFKNPSRTRELGERAEKAARRALAGSEEIAEYWVRLGVALDLQDQWGEAGPAFGRAVRLAPRQPVIWYYQGFHLSLKPMMHEMAKAALATCLRLDPWYDEAKLLKASLERSP